VGHNFFFEKRLESTQYLILDYQLYVMIFRHITSNSECSSNKYPPTIVEGLQFGWNEEILVPSASANAESL